jgi:hypothetical protein
MEQKQLFNSTINFASTTKKTLKIKSIYTFIIFISSKKGFGKFKIGLLKRFDRRGGNNTKKTRLV